MIDTLCIFEKNTPFTPEEQAAIKGQLCELLDMLSAGKTPSGHADEPLTNALYVMGVDENDAESFRPLLREIAVVRYENGLFELSKKRRDAMQLCSALERIAKPLGCRTLLCSLRAIAAHLSGEDFPSRAHVMPEGIRYPIVSALPKASRGVDAVMAYLVLLSAEMKMLSAFAAHRAMAVLDGAAPDWREAPVNICLPVLAHALALSTLSKDARKLHVTDADRETLFALLALKNAEQVEKTLLGAGIEFCSDLGLEDMDVYVLMMQAAKQLAPAVLDACKAGNLAAVFPGFSRPRVTSCSTD